VHTIVSWDFAMTINPMWNSTIFAPYFVVGAIFSGIAALIAAMAVLRRVLHLEAYLEEKHFSNLALLLLVMSLLWGYFTFTEYLTVWYANEPAEMAVWWSKVAGPYSPLFYTMIVCCFVVPVPVIAFKRTRRIPLPFFAMITVSCSSGTQQYTLSFIVPKASVPTPRT